MHLRDGAWGKKSIAKLPNLSKGVEATSLTLPSPKGETPPQGRSKTNSIWAHHSSGRASGARSCISAISSSQRA